MQPDKGLSMDQFLLAAAALFSMPAQNLFHTRLEECLRRCFFRKSVDFA